MGDDRATIHVLLADDHPVMCAGTRTILESVVTTKPDWTNFVWCKRQLSEQNWSNL